MQAAEIQSGMDIFNITQPPYKELAHLEHELELLSKMWGVVADWETAYGGWKNGHFKELKVSLSTCTRGLLLVEVLKVVHRLHGLGHSKCDDGLRGLRIASAMEAGVTSMVCTGTQTVPAAHSLLVCCTGW